MGQKFVWPRYILLITFDPRGWCASVRGTIANLYAIYYNTCKLHRKGNNYYDLYLDSEGVPKPPTRGSLSPGPPTFSFFLPPVHRLNILSNYWLNHCLLSRQSHCLNPLHGSNAVCPITGLTQHELVRQLQLAASRHIADRLNQPSRRVNGTEQHQIQRASFNLISS